MALFLVRAGADGEHEERFFSTSRIYLPWDEVEADLSFAKTYDDIRRFLLCLYPDEPPHGNWAGQVFAFAAAMKPGDMVVVPRAHENTMAIGQIVGPYEYDPEGGTYRHSRRVRWLHESTPRTVLQQDLDSISASMTVCPISRYDAEERIRSAVESADASPTGETEESHHPPTDLDCGHMARQQIAAAIRQRFSGPRLVDLVRGLLHARGYETSLSAHEHQGFSEMLAVPRALGAREMPFWTVVATDDGCLGLPALNGLAAAMQKLRCEDGLLVSWAGTDAAVERERREFFFRARVWGEQELVNEFVRHYRKLGRDIREGVPLKRVWILAR